MVVCSLSGVRPLIDESDNQGMTSSGDEIVQRIVGVGMQKGIVLFVRAYSLGNEMMNMSSLQSVDLDSDSQLVLGEFSRLDRRCCGIDLWAPVSSLVNVGERLHAVGR